METPKQTIPVEAVTSGVTKLGIGRGKLQDKDRCTFEKRKDAIFVPSGKTWTNSNNNSSCNSSVMMTHKIQVVRDIGVGARGVGNLCSSIDRERPLPTTGSHNITLTFGDFDDAEPEEGISSIKIPDREAGPGGRSNFVPNPVSIKGLVSSESSDRPSEGGDYREKDVGLVRLSKDLNENQEVVINSKGQGKAEECNDKETTVPAKSIQTDQSLKLVENDSRKSDEAEEVSAAGKSSSASTSESTLTPDNTKPDDLAFCDPRQNQVFQMLTEVQGLRRSGRFVDLLVKVEDQEFRCHKFILACNSPYFRGLIEEAEQKVPGDNPVPKKAERVPSDDGDKQPKEKTEDDMPPGEKAKDGFPEGVGNSGDQPGSVSNGKSEDKWTLAEITVCGIHPDIFSKVLDFLYCVFDEVITENTALELLLAADTLQLNYLSRTCANYITDTLSPNNVFDVVSLWDTGFARMFEPKVLRRCHEVLREHFTTLCQCEEFLTLGRHHMIPLVADSMLHVTNEMLVVQALLGWVKFRPSERTSDMTLMLQHIRFPLMTSQELDKLTQVPLLKENSLAMALVEESRAYGAMDYNDRLSWPRQNCISRCQFPSRDYILWTADRDKGLHLYSIIDGQHHKVTSFTDAIGGSAGSGNFSFDSTSSICCYGPKIFFTGGEFSTDMTWSVDTATGEVKVHAKMPRGRKFHSMVASRGCLYCLGGQDKRGYTVLDSVDAYVMEKDVWVKVGHLSVPAYNMAAVVSGGVIYMVGGADHSGQPLRLVQCFIALRSGLYSAFKIELNNMPPSLLSARAVTSGFDGLVYIVCGHGEVYKFEPERRHLSHLTTLKNLSDNPRVRFGLAHVGGCLVVIGGHQLGHAMQEPIRSVCLDIASKTEVRDYSPLLPGDIINTCVTVKLSSNALNLFD